MFLEKFFYSFIMSLPVVITTIGILIFLFIKFKKTRTLILGITLFYFSLFFIYLIYSYNCNIFNITFIKKIKAILKITLNIVTSFNEYLLYFLNNGFVYILISFVFSITFVFAIKIIIILNLIDKKPSKVKLFIKKISFLIFNKEEFNIFKNPFYNLRC